MIEEFAGGSVTFLVDGGVNGGDQTQLIAARRRYIQWVREHVNYLPDSTPEAFIWTNMPHDVQTKAITNETAKERFRELARQELGYQDFETLTSEDIFQTQKRRLATIPLGNSDLSMLAQVLQNFARRTQK